MIASRCRLKLAMYELSKALSCKGARQRTYVLIAVRHLICWLVGRTELPACNAISCDDDMMTYCDLCFQKETAHHVDYKDLCMACFDRYYRDKTVPEHRTSEREHTERVQADLAQIDKSREKLYETIGHVPVRRKTRSLQKKQRTFKVFHPS